MAHLLSEGTTAEWHYNKATVEGTLTWSLFAEAFTKKSHNKAAWMDHVFRSKLGNKRKVMFKSMSNNGGVVWSTHSPSLGIRIKDEVEDR